MPAFDPVRDAVRNSPITQTKTLPFRLDLPANSFANRSPASATSSAESYIPAAPSPITRRATDLSVLLNDDPPEPFHQSLFTPTTPRTPSSFSHLLHPDEPPANLNEQLAHAAPLRRRQSIIDREAARESGASYFPINRSPLAFPSNNAPEPRRLPPASPHPGLALPGFSQPPSSPSMALPGLAPASRSRPSTANSSSSEHSSVEAAHDQQPLPSTSRRRSSGASDISRERSGSFSIFTPPTRSPLAFSSQNQELPRSSPSPRPRSPVSPFSVLHTAGSAPPRSPTGPSSRPSTSGSTTAPRAVSPTNAKRAVERKPSNSAQMPPPPVPPPVFSTPQPLLIKQEQITAKSLTHSQPPPPAIPMFPRSNIPYAPRNRITPANSVLVPLSPAELERFRSFTGIGSQILKLHKRKREDGDGDEDFPSKRTRDVGLIAGHYNARPEVGINQRRDSPIIGLKSFNNWVKSVLITSQAHPVLANSENSGPLRQVSGQRGMRGPPRGSGKVLDMGCGKGGDLIKWNKAKIREYVGVDIAAVSIDQARKRYDELRSPKFNAYFAAADCYAQLLSSALPDSILPPLGNPFDVISMQFCMHYAFESEKKARMMIENVCSWLRPGGRFVGTIPNASWLFERLESVPPDETNLSFGNSVYSIRFEQRDHRPLYGNRYWFYLKDAVDDVPEYIVDWDNFLNLADEYGLEPVYVKEFHEVFAENEEHPEFGPLLQNMKVVDANGESHMDEDQWEAANIYIAFAFEKRAR